MFRFCSITMLSILLLGCAEKESTEYDPARDYFTFANLDAFETRHVALDLNVDFDARTLSGNAVLSMKILDPAVGEIILDTRDLTVDQVVFDRIDADSIPAAFAWGETDARLGTPLVITIPPGLDKDSELQIRIDYRTSPNASALQWLPPELTAGGKHPMMFSQSQSIHGRSWIPLQDTPAVRVTYEAVIRTPADLLAVMSADNDSATPRDGEYHFDMPQAIPAYLIAIAVGNLYFETLGDETGVYTEPELLEASVYEFADLQAMLEVAEELFGPYQWGRYDLLVLPPSFPYGGMENPRLSFLTPSLLAGDRSLVSVVAHELAHSWSGNLVTNATWRDSWLNEGMTSYLEGRLMEVIYDVDRVDEERVLNYAELQENFALVPIERQALAPRVDSGDADSVQGTIHYHKGSLFLEYLEQEFGREKFDPFIFEYFNDFAFRTIRTEEFLDYLQTNLLDLHPGIISREQVEAWMYQPGLPPDAPVPASRTLDEAAQLAAAFSAGEATIDDIPIDEWSPQATRYFIDRLAPDLADARLREIDDGLGLSTTGNAEIARTWFIQVAKRRYRAAYPAMEAYLAHYGRARLVAPIFGALAANGEDDALAREIFQKVRGNYHPITNSYIEATLQRVAKQ